MKPALLLIDLQSDFLERRGLFPRASLLVAQAAALLASFRRLGMPVFHIHTEVRADGTDRMPHWKRDETWACVAGTPGVLAPAELAPQDGEARFVKQFYSAFAYPALDAALRARGIDVLVVAGVYLHGCVRATVLDAYQRGYQIWIADEAVGSTEPEHSEVTRLHLDGRAASFLDTASLLDRLSPQPIAAGGGPVPGAHSAAPGPVPVAHVAGRWVESTGQRRIARRNPSLWSEVIAEVPIATEVEVAMASRAATEAQGAWARRPGAERAAALERWADDLAGRSEELALAMATEVGKPLADGRDEVRRAAGLARAAAQLFGADAPEKSGAVAQRSGAEPRRSGAEPERGGTEPERSGAKTVRVRYRPHRVVGLITPWNNPVAIAVGKLAPALGAGNGVVWKPATQAPRTAMALMESLVRSGLPDGLVNLVFGDAGTARALIDDPRVAAVSLTGSIETGRTAAVRCLWRGKPLQAELGGNNAAIVLRDCDVRAEARALAAAAFSFAGQRCTRIQRFIVERSILERFESELVEAVERMKIGEVRDPHTEVGPVISREHAEWVRSLVERAASRGARVLCGGQVPESLAHGCWLSPALVTNVDPDSRIVREEIFGPAAVILPADDLDHAIELANRVEHGLVAALHGGNAAARRRFAEAVDAGILKLVSGPLDVSPDAPFGGWKASRLGPPEHGVWDRDFYARVQAAYGDGEW